MMICPKIKGFLLSFRPAGSTADTGRRLRVLTCCRIRVSTLFAWERRWRVSSSLQSHSSIVRDRAAVGVARFLWLSFHMDPEAIGSPYLFWCWTIWGHNYWLVAPLINMRTRSLILVLFFSIFSQPFWPEIFWMRLLVLYCSCEIVSGIWLEWLQN